MFAAGLWGHLFMWCLTIAVLTQHRLGAVESASQSLDGEWRFAPDPTRAGLLLGYTSETADRAAWRLVRVPHTWQVERGYEHYTGTAWYAREFVGSPAWRGRAIWVEFGSVNRDARIWLNGNYLGEHRGAGYTPFRFEITQHWRAQANNLLVVEVDNRPSTNALPYRTSFDWPPDGGILRSVRLLALPPSHISRMLVDAQPSSDLRQADLQIRVHLRLPAQPSPHFSLSTQVFAPGGQRVNEFVRPGVDSMPGGESEIAMNQTLMSPLLWHFDQPHLYRLVCLLTSNGVPVHQAETLFGIRRVEIRPGRFVLNGEPMRLMGVEWMPGSDPQHGLAEDPRSRRKVLRDLKQLNCVLTRFHWQQDPEVFEFFDREGILVQEEVPAWGRHPLVGTHLAALQETHLREMILPHYNHPSIFAWGLCNEIVSLTPEGHAFVKQGREVARSLDAHRLLSMASNVMHEDPPQDAGGMLDFLAWNDYSSTWFGGQANHATHHLSNIRAAWPDKGIVISEYGLCECHPRLPKGDLARIDLFREHTAIYRQDPAIAGVIYFSYNDYRTHVGDKGDGVFQQRVHGVVDLLGRPKPSYAVLRAESSPIRQILVSPPTSAGDLQRSQVRLLTRSLTNDLPAYSLRGYTLLWTVHDRHDAPQVGGRRLLPDLPPGTDHTEELSWLRLSDVGRIRVEVRRPTGYGVLEAEIRLDALDAPE
jgi:beta-glucuronidase